MQEVNKPNAIFKHLTYRLAKAHLAGDVTLAESINRMLITHFSKDTILGNMCFSRNTLEESLNSDFDKDMLKETFSRIRTGVQKYTKKSYDLSCARLYKSCAHLLPEGLEPNRYDYLFDSWLTDKIQESVKMEYEIINEAKIESDTNDLPSELVPLVLERASGLLESMIAESLGDDPRQIEVVKSWANDNSGIEYRESVSKHVMPAKEFMLQFVSNENQKISSLATEAISLAESVLNKEVYDSMDIKKALFVLESERTLRKVGE
jgi:hypothetical protein